MISSIEELPKLSIARFSELPSFAGIYLVIDGRGVLLYIGQSVDIRRRWKGNHHCKTFLKGRKDVVIAWVEMENKSERLATETLLIKFYDPDFNNSNHIVHPERFARATGIKLKQGRPKKLKSGRARG